jgi:hypothetical protein
LEEEADMSKIFKGWVSSKAALQAALFGYDFFISYRHADAATYARSLHDALSERGFDCFLDTRHYAAGHNLPWLQTQALKSATKLLVVVSERAHVSPPDSTDWLLAEVREFRRLHGDTRAIVPIGSPDSLSEELHSGSKLLNEIPKLANHDICIFDPSVAGNAEVSPPTVAKIRNDFLQMRRRRFRLVASVSAILGLAASAVVVYISNSNRVAADNAKRVADAFGLLDRGRDALGNQGAERAYEYFSRSAVDLERLNLDPTVARHHIFAADLQRLKVSQIADVGSGVASLHVSDDGKWALAIYDHYWPSGENADEDIPDWRAFGVFSTVGGELKLEGQVASSAGRQVYRSGSTVLRFEPPDKVVVRTVAGNERTLSRVDLISGIMEPCPAPCGIRFPGPARTVSPEAAQKAASLLQQARLFGNTPEDGANMGYGPSVAPRVDVESPDGRTAFAGTFEGNILLVDRATGVSRGELNLSGEDAAPADYLGVSAASYQSDGSAVFFTAGNSLWRLEASAYPNVLELAVELRDPVEPFQAKERILAADLSQDGAQLVLVTTKRTILHGMRSGRQSSWDFPQQIDSVAGIRIDQNRSRIDIVVGNDCSIATVRFGSPATAVSMMKGAAECRAWLDPVEPVVWRFQSLASGKTQAQASSLPEGDRSLAGQTIDIPDVAGVIQTAAHLDGHLLLFYGDAVAYSDDSLLDTGLKQMQLSSPGEWSDFNLFEAQASTDYLGEQHWAVEQVESIHPESTPNHLTLKIGRRYMALRNGPEPIKLFGDLAAGEWADGEHLYSIGLTGTQLKINHSGSGILRYDLPWPYADEPTLGLLKGRGRFVLLANSRGEVMVVDLLM